MSSKSKHSSKSGSSKKSVKSAKSTTSKKTKKVVPIVDALKVDCPEKRCGSKKGHRCVSIHYNKGAKRNNPHRVRIQLALKKLAPAKTKKHAA
jgi:hypothetical protein